MHGWLKILSRYGLFKETIRVFLQNLRKQKPGLYEEIKDELSQNYLEKDFDLTEKDTPNLDNNLDKIQEIATQKRVEEKKKGKRIGIFDKLLGKKEEEETKDEGT